VESEMKAPQLMAVQAYACRPYWPFFGVSMRPKSRHRSPSVAAIHTSSEGEPWTQCGRPLAVRRKAPKPRTTDLMHRRKRPSEAPVSVTDSQFLRGAKQAASGGSLCRTIQRVRNRFDLPRLNKRDTPSFKAHRFMSDEKQLIRNTVESKFYLGPYRLGWDLQNQHGLNISSSTKIGGAPESTSRHKRPVNSAPPPISDVREHKGGQEIGA
jgi:hypothetical protein